MTEADLRDVLMMRALEREATALAPSDPLALGLVSDLAWAGAEASRRLDALALPGPMPPDLPLAWLAERARLGLGRCAQRWGNGLQQALGDATPGPGPKLAWAVVGAAFLLGGVGDGLGDAHQINLLSLPMLGLLAWHLGVYALLAGRALWLRWPAQRGSRRRASQPGAVQRLLLAWLARGQAVLLAQAGAPASAQTPGVPGSYLHWARVQAGFTQDWLAVTRHLQITRLTALVHAAAACLALGVVASLYARGLVLDYRAGWDSTFLDGDDVHLLLGLLLGPAAALSGQALPDATALTELRLASGGSEGAARWIHLWALTLGLAVVLPRLALATVAWAGARRQASRLALPAGASDLQVLLQSASGAPQTVWLLPYSYQLDAARQAVLATLVARRLGPQLSLQAQPSLPQGAEDALPAHLQDGLQDGLPTQAVLLFALTATPERESHGAMVSALLAHLAGRCPLQVWVDESGWRQRLPGAAGTERAQQRRQAWTRLLAGWGQVPVFVDLGPAAAP